MKGERCRRENHPWQTIHDEGRVGRWWERSAEGKDSCVFRSPTWLWALIAQHKKGCQTSKPVSCRLVWVSAWVLSTSGCPGLGLCWWHRAPGSPNSFGGKNTTGTCMAEVALHSVLLGPCMPQSLHMLVQKVPMCLDSHSWSSWTKAVPELSGTSSAIRWSFQVCGWWWKLFGFGLIREKKEKQICSCVKQELKCHFLPVLKFSKLLACF